MKTRGRAGRLQVRLNGKSRASFYHLIDTDGDTGSDCGSFVFTNLGCLEVGEVIRDNVLLPFEEKWCGLRTLKCSRLHRRE